MEKIYHCLSFSELLVPLLAMLASGSLAGQIEDLSLPYLKNRSWWVRIAARYQIEFFLLNLSLIAIIGCRMMHSKCDNYKWIGFWIFCGSVALAMVVILFMKRFARKQQAKKIGRVASFSRLVPMGLLSYVSFGILFALYERDSKFPITGKWLLDCIILCVIALLTWVVSWYIEVRILGVEPTDDLKSDLRIYKLLKRKRWFQNKNGKERSTAKLNEVATMILKAMKLGAKSDLEDFIKGVKKDLFLYPEYANRFNETLKNDDTLYIYAD